MLCLDFVNTLDLRRSLRLERLQAFGDLVAFLREHDLLDGPRAGALEARAAADPAWARAELDGALALREALFAVLSAAVGGTAVPSGELAAVNTALAARAAPPRLVPGDDRLALRWGTDDEDPLAAVLRSAAELVSGDGLARVRECPGSPGKACGWLFVDRTKNGNRVWCVGELCGNRTRAHRRHRRERAARQG